MIGRTIRHSLWCLVATQCLYASGALAQGAPAQGAPIGTRVVASITFGDGYAGNLEVYDANITVLEILRGDKAWELVRKASESNKPPAAGSEYLLAKVRFEFAAKEQGTKAYRLREDQFVALSSKGTEYDSAQVSPLQPGLNGAVYPGDAQEGWIVLVVAKDDAMPQMTFRGSVDHGAGTAVFRLY